MKKLIEQMIKFGFVGFLCFFIDYGILMFLAKVLGFHHLLAGGISFTVSVVVNYILSIAFVFETDKNADKKKEFVIFVFLSVIGLGVNELCLYVGVDLMKIPSLTLVKVGATAVVMVYNFISRKIFIEKKN